jgi:hypothetical protein
LSSSSFLINVSNSSNKHSRKSTQTEGEDNNRGGAKRIIATNRLRRPEGWKRREEGKNFRAIEGIGGRMI